MKKENRNTEILRLRFDENKKLSEIAEILGICHQRVWQIIKRERGETYITGQPPIPTYIKERCLNCGNSYLKEKKVISNGCSKTCRAIILSTIKEKNKACFVCGNNSNLMIQSRNESLVVSGLYHVRYICHNCNNKRRAKYNKSESGRVVLRKIQRKQNAKYKEKVTARSIVRRALKSGALIKPSKCSSCFNERKLDAHHDNYSKPLEIVWLCRKCHFVKHGRSTAVNIVL